MRSGASQGQGPWHELGLGPGPWQEQEPGPGLAMGLLEREWDMEQVSLPLVTSILVVSRTSLSFSLRKDTVLHWWSKKSPLADSFLRRSALIQHFLRKVSFPLLVKLCHPEAQFPNLNCTFSFLFFQIQLSGHKHRLHSVP